MRLDRETRRPRADVSLAGFRVPSVPDVHPHDPCAYCGRFDLTVMTSDHIVPRSKGGKHKGNLAAACGSCNARKGTQSLLQFVAELWGS